MLIKVRPIIDATSNMEVETNEEPRGPISMKCPEKSAVRDVSGDVNNRPKSQVNVGRIVYCQKQPR